ncbi:hypothetical protein OQA88_3565 [Cercophora sp. LCS_1]
MSKIEKLSILGTIIECLKYATTGELPPNSKGGAFIHDPDLAGEKEVLAQVKLSFRSTVGEAYVVTRNVSLSVKQKTRRFKTLDGSLSLRHNGERNVLSARNVELEKLVPEKLGVSPAVLDCVIFCHQDESLWPMSEPAALKKRFDEIFEAQKYTKVIDNIKSVRKKKGDELKVLKVHESHEKNMKERSEKVDAQMSNLTTEIEQSRDRCNQLLQEMDEESVKIKEKYTQANDFLKIVNDLQTKQEKLEYKREAIEELQSRIEEMSDSDQTLRNILDEYEKTIERTISDRASKTRQFHELQAELKSSREKHTAKAAEQGKHQSDKDKYERQLVLRSQMIKDAAERHEIRGYDDELDDHQIQAFSDRIQKMWTDKKRELERLQRENAAEIDQKAGVIAEREAKKASVQKDRSSTSQRMAVLSRDVSKLQTELGRLDVDEGAEAVLRTEMRELETKIETAKADEQTADLDAQVQTAQDEIWKLEAQAAKLNRELVECSRLASERAQLDLRKKQVIERQRELQILKSTWDEQLSAVVGGEWQPETIESAYQEALGRQAGVVAERRKQKDSVQQELKQIEYKLSAARERQNKLSTERDRCKAAVLKALQEVECENPALDVYTEELEELQKSLTELESDLSAFDKMKEYNLKAMSHATEKNKCFLCTRSFGDDAPAKTKLVERLHKLLDDKVKKKLEVDIATHTQDLMDLKAVRPQYDTCKRLEGELPALAREISTMTTQKDEVVRKLEDHDAAYREAEEKKQEMDALGKNVLKIAQTQKDIADSERQVERSQQSSGITTRSAEEVNEEQSTCAEQTRVAQANLSKLTTDRQRMKDAIGQLELERLELRHRITEAVQALERKKNLQETIRRHKEDQGQLREAIQKADSDVQALEPQIASARAALEEAREQGRTKELRLAEERDVISKTVSELKMIGGEIQDYLDRGGPSNLVSNQRAVATLEDTIARLESEMKDLTVQINKLTKDIDNSDAKKRNISDNLTYRKNIRERQILEQEIEELESRDARQDYDRLVNEARFLESRRAKMSAERERLMGTMSSKDEEWARLHQEWELDLKDAAHKFKEAHIKVETMKAAIEDLGRGHKALDNAILHYHSLKMEEINRTIAELWQSTYQGTDIDTIQIRSDVESGNTDSARRTYNYRVSMVKGDAEMDMRGRCSAGQKVLASIIIRLALAESFGINCGLIALDEPTTNLDSDNIRSLAESLHSIIKARRGQGNLQLIVITHDEEFLKHMQCSDFCDDFYRVKRDEKQNSVILRESITRIME